MDASKTAKVASEESVNSWLDIQNEYVTDIRKKPYSLKDIAKKFNISYDYVRQYAVENDCASKSQLHLTNVSQKTVDNISSDMGNITFSNN